MIIRKLLIFSLIFIPSFILGIVVITPFAKARGAQDYTKILWKNNYAQISPNKVTELINQERIKKGVKELNTDKEVCKTADKLAEIDYKKFYRKFYKVSKIQIEKSDEEIISKTCPNTCNGKRYSILSYTSLRPETCFNDKKINSCYGDESLGLLENYPKRSLEEMKKISSDKHNIFFK